jgi:hypothetical protein
VKRLSAIGYRLSALLFAGLVLGLGCGGSGSGAHRAAGDTLSERQRDSILAKSSIPGASAVGRAMSAADSTSARVQASDSIQ